MYASPWSPPAFMKTNNDILHGGKLKPEFYQSWANYYVKFFQAYTKEDIPFWGLTCRMNQWLCRNGNLVITAQKKKEIL
jgi:glucosylceramidase